MVIHDRSIIPLRGYNNIELMHAPECSSLWCPGAETNPAVDTGQRVIPYGNRWLKVPLPDIQAASGNNKPRGIFIAPQYCELLFSKKLIFEEVRPGQYRNQLSGYKNKYWLISGLAANPMPFALAIPVRAMLYRILMWGELQSKLTACGNDSRHAWSPWQGEAQWELARD